MDKSSLPIYPRESPQESERGTVTLRIPKAPQLALVFVGPTYLLSLFLSAISLRLLDSFDVVDRGDEPNQLQSVRSYYDGAVADAQSVA